MKRLEFAIIGILVGIALGLRYKILILMAAVMLAIVFVIIVGIARADSVWSIALTTVGVVIAVQLSYLAGVAIRGVIESVFPQKGGHNSDADLVMRVFGH
jgi:hypothetical protein